MTSATKSTIWVIIAYLAIAVLLGFGFAEAEKRSKKCEQISALLEKTTNMIVLE